MTITNWDSLLRCTPFMQGLVHYLTEKKDLLNFELVCKGHVKFTDTAWKILRTKHYLDFEFSTTSRDLSQKSRYIFAHRFVKERQSKENSGSEGGDLLAKGLFALKNGNMELAFNHFLAAIPKKGTYGALWFSNQVKENNEKKCQLALLAASHNDSRALEKVLYADKSHRFLSEVESLKHLPCVIAYCARSKINLDHSQSEALFDQAIDKYGKKVPFKVLVGTILVKSNTHKWNEIDLLVDKVFKQYQNPASLAFLCHAVAIKAHSKKFEEADRFFNLVWNQFGYRTPSYVLDLGVLVKFTLNKEAEAFELAKQIVLPSRRHHHIPSWIWEVAAQERINKNKWDIAEDYLELLVEMGVESPHIFRKLANVKSNLGKHKEAEIYTQRASECPSESSETLGTLMQIKVGLQDWQKVNKLFEKALIGQGWKVPSDILTNATMAKLQLNMTKLEISL